mmetsp:Transcript_8043/g.17442  ORF Transcript_8043/g.17442 Transcript_8043/m.17442 type:complete len:360 (+) Transcript_8043:266-1345(+)|eukprot:CAMPEP_0183735220 /NCGR_PEP_ID=MMETSP0737-20130205/46013_1 /TAXON_ID=385413 /ORGANISM="Thalassiosira miniscula, Strain CCMP1093" /LENGTH=359 /DNA_ID=CAMNT_0025968893 /DNA_START=198 /DNA_END=1277 /DNA_ORIENTATION=-
MMALASLLRAASIINFIFSGDTISHCNGGFAHALTFAPLRSNGRQIGGANRFFGHPTIRRDPFPILYTKSDDDDDFEKDSQSDDPAMTGADLEKQKLALENMLKSSTVEGEEISSTDMSILTSSRKQRLEREIQLLKQLDPDHSGNNPDYSDLQNQELVVSQLWSLWYGERGSMNERKLHAIEDTLMDPSLWPEAENQYLALINEHCSDSGSKDGYNLSNWVEPANRLATLLYLMGRFGESKQWCERILSAKPWHIGALSGVVMVCMKMGDEESVLKYSEMGMPNLTTEMRGKRKEWVSKQVQFAEKNLCRLEELSMKAYGKSDESGSNYAQYEPSTEMLEDDRDQVEGGAEEDNSAWQ